MAYLSVYLGLFWIKLQHLPNLPVPLCQAQPPTVDPAVETTAHEIIRARPTHSKNKDRPTFTPYTNQVAYIPKLYKIQNLVLSFLYSGSHAFQNDSQGTPAKLSS